MPSPRDVEVTFEEISSEQGGLSHSLVTGARPQFFYRGHDWDCHVEIIAPVADAQPVGVRAFLAFLSPDEHLGRLNVGMAFVLRHGRRTVAFGTIVRLVDLEASAKRAAADPTRASRSRAELPNAGWS